MEVPEGDGAIVANVVGGNEEGGVEFGPAG